MYPRSANPTSGASRWRNATWKLSKMVIQERSSLHHHKVNHLGKKRGTSPAAAALLVLAVALAFGSTSNTALSPSAAHRVKLLPESFGVIPKPNPQDEGPQELPPAPAGIAYVDLGLGEANGISGEAVSGDEFDSKGCVTALFWPHGTVGSRLRSE